MTIEFQCTSCGQQYSVGTNHAGKLIRCQSCKAQVRIPVANGASAVPQLQAHAQAQAQARAQAQAQAAAAQVPASPPSPQSQTTTDLEAGAELPAALNEMLMKHLTYQRTAPIPEIQSDLEKLRSFDKHHEQKERKFLLLMTSFIGVTIVFFALTAILMANEQTTPGVICIVIGIVGLVLSIINGIAYRKHARLNLEDNRYECMNEFLRLIAVDAGEVDNLSAKLVFGKHDRKEAHTGSGKVGYWDVEFFANEWFSLAGRFKDGSKFTLSIKEKQQNRSRWKRSMSGKMKHKSKTKNSEEISLVIRPKAKRYPDLQKLVPDAAQSLQIPQYAELKKFTFQQSAIVLKVAIRGNCLWRTHDNINQQVKERVHLLAMVMLSVYQTLNLSRELQKAAG